MKKILCYIVFYGFLATGFTVLSAQADEPLFSSKKETKNFYFYRSYVDKKSKLAGINPAGVVISKKSYGPGLYSVTFAVDESHKKFQYHQQYFIFFFTPEVKNAAELKSKMKKGAEYLYLVWRKSGQLDFFRHTKDGKNNKIGIWIMPGPKKDNAYEKNTFVTMNVIVPQAGEDIKIYFNKPAEGEADCELIMPDSPRKGMFGFYNPKWYSYIQVKDIKYREIKK